MKAWQTAERQNRQRATRRRWAVSQRRRVGTCCWGSAWRSAACVRGTCHSTWSPVRPPCPGHACPKFLRAGGRMPRLCAGPAWPCTVHACLPRQAPWADRVQLPSPLPCPGARPGLPRMPDAVLRRGGFLYAGEAPEEGAAFRARARRCQACLQLFLSRTCPLFARGLPLGARALALGDALHYAAAALCMPAALAVPAATAAAHAFPLLLTWQWLAAAAPYLALTLAGALASGSSGLLHL